MVQDWDSMDREMLYSRDNMEQASTSRGREVRVTIVIISEILIQVSHVTDFIIYQYLWVFIK